jgi:hypothetical protein
VSCGVKNQNPPRAAPETALHAVHNLSRPPGDGNINSKVAHEASFDKPFNYGLNRTSC